MSKAVRKGRIFIDYMRNYRGATSVAAYSTRARAGAPVSVPLAWDELEPKLRPDTYSLANVEARLDRMKKDPWAGYDKTKQKLPTAAAKSR
jgi:bifunctional non-homologous end joining protein LigD